MLYDSYSCRRRASYKSTPCHYASSTVSHDWFCIHGDWGISKSFPRRFRFRSPLNTQKLLRAISNIGYLLLERASFVILRITLIFQPNPQHSYNLLNLGSTIGISASDSYSIPQIRHSFPSRMTRAEFDAPLRGSAYPTNQSYSYECLSASPVCSSSSSIFSQDDRSTQSSAPSSSKSFLNVPWDSEPSATYANELLKAQPRDAEATQVSIQPLLQNTIVCATQADCQVPKELRQHPRRTQPTTQVSSDSEAPLSNCIRPPPPLVRQCDRKDNFVESLVGELTFSVIPVGSN